MDEFYEYIDNLFQTIVELFENITNDSVDLLNEYGGFF